MLRITLFSYILWIYFDFGLACVPKDYGFGSIVCVCNLSNCTLLGPIEIAKAGTAKLYESTKDGSRFKTSNFQFSSKPPKNGRLRLEISIDRTKRYQEILGFGGAFTDAVGINILSLPEQLQDQILRGYYSSDGLDYTFGRVPIASCDFSTHVYSYDDVPGDANLTHFNLTEEDSKLKIPLIHRAQKMQSKSIKLFASPWSAPGWMKSSRKMGGPGILKEEYYQTWAEYFVKFLKSYEKNNISFWGLTIENEPSAGFIPFYSFQSMGFTPATERNFLKNYLVPTLRANQLGPEKIKLIIMDDQRLFLPFWPLWGLDDKEARSFVSGIGFHWYWNAISPVKSLDLTHDAFPDKFLLATEACSGSGIFEKPSVQLGSWKRAEDYAHDIIEDLLHWTTGWIDWNLALNTNGGPNWVKNFVDSPIIVNATSVEFYQQPVYFALAHFSKFLPPGSVRIDSSMKGILDWFIEVAAFERPDKAIVLILINRRFFKIEYVFRDDKWGYVSNSIPAHAIQTYIWRS
ncbi:glucosylceramidase-like [Centruroides sculpturatus]|uniref:glucosylceramidase-like n=1 Tax=Centruroides sculpturatus TaxID=218467 RepID=UPI000C6E1D0D|nr:glucosylceramidase-like [Centruroides sculpturatus]XP_023235440.1 glucosylceramidase-like [Centruroides sculpturatus]XP_023235441.1 glucosylceramidase-like [Centruroides sculpturatus]